jgi:predicted lysophospholipase L1 biosynthesis ABC-type transport system permease subunit
MATNAEVRRRFFRHLWKHSQVVWPVVSGLVGFQLFCGAVIGFLERWSVSETIYFTFVTALTIGFGDLAPKRIASRMITLAIGLSGVLLMALVAALSVRSLQDAAKDE